VVILFGCQASGLNDVQRAIENRFGLEYVIHVQEVKTAVDFDKQLKILGARRRQGTTVVLIPSDLPWTEEWVKLALKKARQLRIPEAAVTFLFAVDPAKAWQIIKTGGSFSLADLQIMQLHPWQDAAVRQWLEDSPFGPQDRDVRNKIRNTTGNWPMLLYETYERMETKGILDEKTFEDFHNDMRSPSELRNRLVKAFGLNLEGPTPVLKTLAIYGDNLEQDDILTVFEEGEFEERKTQVKQSLEWANLFGPGQKFF
jgi:hypothetical protein